MWLLKEYRGRKLGYTLVRQLQAFARQAGYRAMRLTTDLEVQQPAIAFYRRLGFREIAVIPEKNDVMMEQAL
jgi:ribosomal protein S18 acetylase RimI-like enzyme